MRVTSNTFNADLITQLGTLSREQSRLQAQTASGQRISLPEDDPSATARVLDLQTEMAAVTQYQHNIASQQTVSQATFSVIQSLKKISDRANEIATLADGLKSPDQMTAYAAEVTQLIRQAAQLGNTKLGGNYLLGGTKNDAAPFSLTDGPDGQVAAASYAGNDDLSEVEISEGVTITAHVVGSNTSASGARGLMADARSGADLLKHLISLQDHLVAGDSAAIAATDRAQLAADEDNILYHVANNGATAARLESSGAIASQRTSSLQKSVSNEADADLAETLVRFNQTQTAYQAALQTGASMLRLSLLDYLR